VVRDDKSGSSWLIRQHAYQGILLDLCLGTESGLDLLQRMREVGVDAPVIILTGFAEVETAVAAMKLGATDYAAAAGSVAA